MGNVLTRLLDSSALRKLWQLLRLNFTMIAAVALATSCIRTQFVLMNSSPQQCTFVVCEDGRPLASVRIFGKSAVRLRETLPDGGNLFGRGLSYRVLTESDEEVAGGRIDEMFAAVRAGRYTHVK